MDTAKKTMLHPICPACDGVKEIEIRVLRLVRGHYAYVSRMLTCLMCHGTGQATTKDMKQFCIEEPSHALES